MKTFLMKFEDLWVAVAFAEAGEYGSLGASCLQPRSKETVRIQAV